MNETANVAKILGDSPNATADSPLSSLGLPGRILKLLEDNGVTNVGGLALRMEDDPKSILAIGGIGPKTLLSIRTALETTALDSAEEYRVPVQSLGDQFQSVPSAEPKEAVKKEKKGKEKKPKKADKKKDKKLMKTDKKKDKKSKKVDKKRIRKPVRKRIRKPVRKRIRIRNNYHFG